MLLPFKLYYPKIKNSLADIACLLIAVLFLYAALSKLYEFSVFKIQLSKSPFIVDFAGLLAWLLPAAEIAVSISLMIMPLRLAGLYASLFLLTLFTAYLTAMLLFSYYIPCSCGGVLSTLSWKEHIVVNSGFIILNLIAIFIVAGTSQKNINPITSV